MTGEQLEPIFIYGFCYNLQDTLLSTDFHFFMTFFLPGSEKKTGSRVLLFEKGTERDFNLIFNAQPIVGGKPKLAYIFGRRGKKCRGQIDFRNEFCTVSMSILGLA